MSNEALNHWEQRCESEKARADLLASELQQTKTRLEDVQRQHSRIPKPSPQIRTVFKSLGLRGELARKVAGARAALKAFIVSAIIAQGCDAERPPPAPVASSSQETKIDPDPYAECNAYRDCATDCAHTAGIRDAATESAYCIATWCDVPTAELHGVDVPIFTDDYARRWGMSCAGASQERYPIDCERAHLECAQTEGKSTT